MTKKTTETSPTVESLTQPSGDESTNLAEYAQQVELPIYVAPVVPSLSFPLLQYAKKVKVVSGYKPTTYTGFLIGIEQSAELDDLFAHQGLQPVRIQHRNGTDDTYWPLDTVECYVLCTAVPLSYGRDAWMRSGIAYVWNEHQGTYAYGSQLQCMVFLRGLLQVGYTQPLILSLSRTVTEYFVSKVLRRQEATIETIKKALKSQGKPDQLAFYAYWVELAKSPEEITLRNGGTYYPPTALIPSPLTVGYVRTHEATPGHLAVIEAALPLLMPWAEAASIRLLEPPRDNTATTPEGTAQQPEQPAAE